MGNTTISFCPTMSAMANRANPATVSEQRTTFPAYNYEDMVQLQYRLVTEHLGIQRLRLVIGTSMGGMQTWMWGIRYGAFMDALCPLASQPVEIAGRNRMMRKMIIDSIQNDPQWHGGNYDSQQQQPRVGLVAAIHILLFMGSVPLLWQTQAPTRESAETMLAALVEEQLLQHTDANDMIYYFDASRNYNPAPHLHTIQAPLVAINFADDQVNPPELGILEREIQKVTNGRAITLPISEETRGHGTYWWPQLWQDHLRELLERTQQ